MKPTIKQIKTLNELIKLAGRKKGLECYIALNYGIRSSKIIRYNKEKEIFSIWNFVDDSTINVTKKGIMNSNKTNVGRAMFMGALYAEN
jgi:hypothetical protein